MYKVFPPVYSEQGGLPCYYSRTNRGSPTATKIGKCTVCAAEYIILYMYGVLELSYCVCLDSSPHTTVYTTPALKKFILCVHRNTTPSFAPMDFS